ncbi:MFS transporter [Nocardia salmonicida]|uniref:MFS transporter n=1 Tax=Nocardia salmonicida TaxID=53431 RepID=UPI0033C440DC
MTHPARPTDQRAAIRAVQSGTIGAIVEWYEYTVYGTTAALVFGEIFFPDLAPGVGQIAALASFGVGFLARPIGAFAAGHMGDRIGRKSTLIITFAVMTIATALIGLLPTHGQIGIAAPILLCVLRLAQGFAVGGEWGGAAIVAVENAPRSRRGFFGSWPQIGVSSGLLLGSGAIALSVAVSGDAFEDWGWRIPFLLSIPLAAVGFYIRLRVTESPAFLAEKARQEASKEKQRAPAVVLFRDHRKPLLIAIFARFAEAGNYYLFTTFALSYITVNLGVSREIGLSASMIGAAANIAMIPVYGNLSDRIGRPRTFLIGGACIILTAAPIFLLINTGQVWAIILGISLFMGLGHGMVYAPQPAMYCELFPTAVRYSGISVGYQMASILLSSFTPALAAALLLWSGDSLWPVIAFAIVTTGIAMIAVSFAPDRRALELDQIGVTAEVLQPQRV